MPSARFDRFRRRVAPSPPPPAALVDPPPPLPAPPPTRRPGLDRAFEPFDDAVDAAFDALRGRRWADRLFYTASALGDHSLVWMTLATAGGLRRGGDVSGTVRIASLMGIESALVNGPIKAMFRRERPIQEVARPLHLRMPRTSSFPSGHATAGVVFVIVAGEDDAWVPLYATLAGVVALSRIHVRIHHASDVVGGVVVGSALGLALRWFWPKNRQLPRLFREPASTIPDDEPMTGSSGNQRR